MKLQNKIINNKIPEYLITQAVEKLFLKNGICNIYREVYLGGKYLDILCWEPETNHLIAVESKVSAVSRAFEQAHVYKIVAHQVYVALLANGSNKRALELSSETGIGVILVNKDSRNKLGAKIISKPKISNMIDEKISNHIWALTIDRIKNASE